MIAWEMGTSETTEPIETNRQRAGVETVGQRPGTASGARAAKAGAAAYGDYHWVSPGTRTLRVLDAGDDVTFLQSRIGVTADGYFGPVTAAALTAFREAHGLSPEPVAGREVWGLLITTPATMVRPRRRWWSAAPRPVRT